MDRARTLLDRAVEVVERHRFKAHGIHVSVGDDDLEHRWYPDVREDVHSAAKGVCVLATGVAIGDGVIGLDEPVADALPGLATGTGVDSVTLRHLLTMTSGIDLPWSPTLLTDWPDLAAEFLSRPTRGRAFQYSNASTYTAMRVLATVVGDVGDYVQRRILDPLAIPAAPWRRCPNGFVEAGGGLWLRTAELARVGRLIRARGRCDGHQLVPADVIDAMHADWVRAGDAPGYERYALAGWDGPGAIWRLHGALGQLVLLLGDIVVTVTADDHAADEVAASLATLMAREGARRR